MQFKATTQQRRRVQNTNELKSGSPGRFGIDVYTLGWPMEARILGHEASALGKTDPGVLAMNDPWTEHDREHVITGGTKGAVSCCGV